MGTVYLLCFEQPFGHAHHYCGWASDLDGRLAHHAAGTGANLLRHVAAAGIGWTLVRTWGADKTFERRVKRQGGLARVCPRCSPHPRPMLSSGSRVSLDKPLPMTANGT